MLVDMELEKECLTRAQQVRDVIHEMGEKIRRRDSIAKEMEREIMGIRMEISQREKTIELIQKENLFLKDHYEKEIDKHQSQISTLNLYINE